MVLGSQPMPFFFTTEFAKKLFTLPVVNDNEIVPSTSGGIEGICLVRYICSCWCRRTSQFLVILDTGQKQNCFGWPPRTIGNSSIGGLSWCVRLGVHVWRRCTWCFFPHICPCSFRASFSVCLPYPPFCGIFGFINHVLLCHGRIEATLPPIFTNARLENRTSDRLRISGNLLVTKSSIDY